MGLSPIPQGALFLALDVLSLSPDRPIVQGINIWLGFSTPAETKAQPHEGPSALERRGIGSLP